jgi:Rrf2 family protein
MFSQTAEYALRAIVYLASRHDQACTTQEIAEAARVPAQYLAKVMQSLSRAGLVHSQRGLHGGFTLAIPAQELTVHAVIQAVDPIRRILSCPLGLRGHVNLCPLHRRLDQALAMVEGALQKSTIAELIAEAKPEKGLPKPLCPWPGKPSASSLTVLKSR